MIRDLLSGIAKWIDARWPASYLVRLSLEEDIPGGARFAYTLGSATLIVFVLQAVTGVMQLLYYVPTVDHAYDSLGFLRTQVPFGWLIHGLHYWGANVMVVLVVLHMMRVFVWGAYKSPRELTWLIGVTQLLTVMALSFTGTPLHWDQRGYWATEVGTSIAGSAPLVGDYVKTVMRGAETIGQMTLSRFFTAHVFLLPPALAALITAHLIALRRNGSAGPWVPDRAKSKGPFWPDQVFRDAVVGTGVFLFLLALVVFSPPGISGPADPLDTTYVPKAEWNFLFLYESLKYFPGPLEPIGSVGVPTVLAAVLLLLPFIDRRPERNPFRRPLAMLGGLVFMAFLIGFTIAGYYSKGYGQTPATASRPATAAPSPPRSGQQQAAVDEDIARGAELFKSNSCIGCHSIRGIGGSIGPDLSDETSRGRTRAWLQDQIRNPKSHNPASIMPSFASLGEKDIDTLVEYLLSQRGTAGQGTSAANAGKTADPPPAASPEHVSPGDEGKEHLHSDLEGKGLPGKAAAIIGSAERGEVLFKKNCVQCHGPEAKGGTPNPGSSEGHVPSLNPIDEGLLDSDPAVFAENIDRFIQHGSVPPGTNPALHMPAFGDTSSLTQQEISNIEAYVMSLNGIDRAKLMHPGLMPRQFLLIVAGIFALTALFLGGIRSKRKRRG